jgi:hypothetical protein
VPLGPIHDSTSRTTPTTITQGTPGAEAPTEAPLADSEVGSVNNAGETEAMNIVSEPTVNNAPHTLNGAGETEAMNIMNEPADNNAPHSQFAPVARPDDQNASSVEGDQRSKYLNYSQMLLTIWFCRGCAF